MKTAKLLLAATLLGIVLAAPLAALPTLLRADPLVATLSTK